MEEIYLAIFLCVVAGIFGSIFAKQKDVRAQSAAWSIILATIVSISILVDLLPEPTKELAVLFAGILGMVLMFKGTKRVKVWLLARWN